MNDAVAQVIVGFLTLLLLALLARAILIWFPPGERTNQIARVIGLITDPLVEPIRRILPRTGMIDFSTMIVIVIIYVMINVVNRAADA